MPSSGTDRRGERRSRRWRRFGVALAVVTAISGAIVAWALAGVSPDPWHDAGPAPAQPAGERSASIEVVVEPSASRIDETLSISVSGLVPSEEVVLSLSTEDAEGVEFVAWARYRVDGEGRVDPSTRAPLGGTYRGLDGQGLLWSGRAGGERSFAHSASWGRRTYRLRAESGAGFAEASFERRYPWPRVRHEPVREGGVVGELWLPGPEGAFDELAQGGAAILLLGGWGDGPAPLRSALLADRGFVVLNLGFHGWEGLPPNLVQIPVETVTRALDLLRSRPEVGEAPVGLFGVSKGAELALLAASADDRISAVAAWVPASVTFAGIDLRDPTPGCSWTWRGEPVPCAPPRLGLPEIRNTVRLLLGWPVSFRHGYLAALEATPPEARIAVERIAGPVLLASGGDDRLWPSAEMAREVEDRLQARGFPHPVVNHVFREAGHGLAPALWPQGGGPSRFLIRGGDATANHLAGRQAWAETVAFLDSALGD